MKEDLDKSSGLKEISPVGEARLPFELNPKFLITKRILDSFSTGCICPDDCFDNEKKT